MQTACPSEPAIALAAHHDYLGFAAHELQHRREAKAPPFRSMTRVILRGAVEDRVKQDALAMAALLRANAERLSLDVRILGPSPCPTTKLRDLWRFHLQFSAESFATIRDLWRATVPQVARSSDVEFQIDVDPINMR